MPMREREEIQKVLRGVSDGLADRPRVSRPLRIAGIQCAAGTSREENIKRIGIFAGTAMESGARVIVFPECFSLPWMHTMEPGAYTVLAEPVPGPSTEPFIRMAAARDVFFVCPVFEQENGSRFFSAVVIGPEGVMGVYRKVQPAQVAYWEERQMVNPGDVYPVFDLGFTRIGILMGWDLFFPEAVRILALQGAELIIAPTASAMASQRRWIHVLAGHSICNGLFIFRINRCGTENGLPFYGESFCVDPFGEPIGEPVFHRDAVLLVDIDLEDVARARGEFAFLVERRPDLYGALTRTGELNNESE
ncbi:hypothetical protein JXA80_05455 [bacterium]|nr:hypothetical protein [candidate division CSSED10-310 bacterium]